MKKLRVSPVMVFAAMALALLVGLVTLLGSGGTQPASATQECPDCPPERLPLGPKENAVTPTPTATPTPTPLPVGGILVAPDQGELPPAAADSSGTGLGLLVGLVVGVTAGAVALGGATWYARRRWQR